MGHLQDAMVVRRYVDWCDKICGMRRYGNASRHAPIAVHGSSRTARLKWTLAEDALEALDRMACEPLRGSQDIDWFGKNCAHILLVEVERDICEPQALDVLMSSFAGFRLVSSELQRHSSAIDVNARGSQEAVSGVQESHNDPPDGITAGPVNEDDMFVWEALIMGPEGTPFEGGIFPAELKFPKDYPLAPPDDEVHLRYVASEW
ncbi:hypothetical protein MRB53_041371 [Persea americana]|nr:hypothetical protein MRB53_041371 [Persea americana]